VGGVLGTWKQLSSPIACAITCHQQLISFRQASLRTHSNLLSQLRALSNASARLPRWCVYMKDKPAIMHASTVASCWVFGWSCQVTPDHHGVCAHLCRFPCAPEQQQELQELLNEPVSVAEPGLSRRSSSAGSKCCSRCGESIGVRYTKDGRFASETCSGSGDPDNDVTMGDDDDTDDCAPKGGKGKGGRTPPGRGTKRSARQQQQLPPLPPHGAGHKGAKRQRVASKKLQNGFQNPEEACAEGPGKHTAQAGEGSEGLMCSCCMRQIALQEVQQDCGTTLIVVPANILVQVRASAHHWCSCVQMKGV
jgi:hypothetical protein